MHGSEASVRRSVDAFQRYIMEQDRNNSDSWGGQAQKLIQSVASRLGELCKEGDGRVDLEAVALQMGATIVARGLRDDSLRGSLSATDEGFEIRVGSREPVHRQRFTVAHELGHILFYSAGDGGRARRLLPYGRGTSLRAREEGLCDAFARALLVPEAIASELACKSPSLEEVLDTRCRLGTSGEVILRRMLYDFEAWPKCVFYRIFATGEERKVRPFWGAKRRSRPKGAPTGPELEEYMSGLLDRELKPAICASLPVRDWFQTARSGTVWFYL